MASTGFISLWRKSIIADRKPQGIGCVKLNVPPCKEYIFRERAQGSGAISEIFANVHDRIRLELDEGVDVEDASFAGEVYMGHLRYSTTGRYPE